MALLETNDLTEEELKRSRRLSLALGSVPVIVFGVLIITVGLMICRVRADKLIEESRILSTTNPPKALATLSEAKYWLVRRDEVELAYARTISRIRPSEGIQMFEDYIASHSMKDLSHQDLSDILVLKLYLGGGNGMEGLIQEMRERNPLGAEYEVYNAWIAYLGGRKEEASQMLDEVLQYAPTLPVANLLKGQILLSDSDKSHWIAGKRALILAMKDNFYVGLAAAGILNQLQKPVLLETEKAAVRARLIEHPLYSVTQLDENSSSSVERGDT